MGVFRAIVTLKSLPMVQKGDEIVLDQLLDPPPKGVDWAVLILEDDVPVRLVDLTADAITRWGLLPGVELQLDSRNEPVLPTKKLNLPPVARPLIDAQQTAVVENHVSLLYTKAEVEEALREIEEASETRAKAWAAKNGGGNIDEKKEEIKELMLRSLRQKLMTLFFGEAVAPYFAGGRYIRVGDAGSGKTSTMFAEAEALQLHGSQVAVMVLGERPETRAKFKPALFIRCPEGVSSELTIAAVIAFVSYCMRVRDRGGIIHAFLDSLSELANKIDNTMPAVKMTTGGVTNASKAIIKALFVLFGRSILANGLEACAGITGAVLLASTDKSMEVWRLVFERTANGNVDYVPVTTRDPFPPYPRFYIPSSRTRDMEIAVRWGDLLLWIKGQPNARARIEKAFDWHDPAGSFKHFMDELRAEKEGAERRELMEQLNKQFNDTLREVTINFGQEKVLEWMAGAAAKMAEHPNMTDKVEKILVQKLENELRRIRAERVGHQNEAGRETPPDQSQNRDQPQHRPAYRDDDRRRN